MDKTSIFQLYQKSTLSFEMFDPYPLTFLFYGEKGRGIFFFQKLVSNLMIIILLPNRPLLFLV